MGYRPLPGLALLVVLALAGCSSEPEGFVYPPARKADTKADSDATDGAGSGLPCDVAAVLREKCQTCHGSEPKFGATTALVTWDDLQKPGPGASASRKVVELLKERIHDDAAPMPPSPKARLDAKEATAIDTWIAKGAEKATDALCPRTEAPRDAVKPLACNADTVLKPKTPFTLPPNAPLDQYVCYGVDYDLAKKRHAVAFAPKVDNAKIVHHVLLFQSDSPVQGEPFLCPAAGLAPWKLVAGWNPGGNNLELPPEAGYPLDAGKTHWVVQVHYNNAAAKGGVDQSGYELCTTEELRKHDAGIAAFGSTAFTIPPRSTHTIKCDYKLGAEWNGARFFNASPHMHDLGVAMSSERVPGAGGAPERFFEEKKFSFDAQANYPVSVGLATGDIIRTRCTWKNPGDAMIGFGESSLSEMCFDFIGYYPRIASMPWVSPSVATSCVAE